LVLVCLLVILEGVVIFLQFHDFLTSVESLGLFEILESLFLFKCHIKHVLVSQLLLFDLLDFEFPLFLIKLDELDVPLSVQHKSLVLQVLFFFSLYIPLLVQHLSFIMLQVLVLAELLLSLVLLPVQNLNSFLTCLFLFLELLSFSLNFLLLVKFPQLSVNLLLHNVLLHLTSLVNELLLPLNLAAIILESSFVESQVIVGSSESLLKSPLDLFVSLGNPLFLELLESDSHLLPDLLGSFQVLHEFLFEHHVLLLQKGS